jgi:hypothetical protein
MRQALAQNLAQLCCRPAIHVLAISAIQVYALEFAEQEYLGARTRFLLEWIMDDSL